MQRFFGVVAILLLAAPLAAQTRAPGASVRPAPGVQPLPARPPSNPVGNTPAPNVIRTRPEVDARLGAGGVRGRTGNIVYPGTPGGGRPGSILSPGLPVMSTVGQPLPSDEPEQPPYRDPRGRHHRQPAVVYFPIYGLSGISGTTQVIEVGPERMAGSDAEHVITVDPKQQKLEPVEQDAPDYWLIALRGGLIYAAVDYGVEHNAIWFITLQGDEYVVPAAEVDLEFSKKLNAERGVDFEL